MKTGISLDIIMLSTFDRNAGGRETWLYNFLPELLSFNDIERVVLFGFKMPDEADHYNELLELDMGGNTGHKLYPVILQKETLKVPKAFSMYRKLKKFKDPKFPEPDVTLAMGVFELLMMNRVNRFKNSKKLVWLRSIFLHEKAYAIPKILRKILLRYEVRQLKKADLIIANGDDISDFYGQFGFNIHVIKNGVELSKWAISSPHPQDKIRVAYIGRLSQVKGIEDFLKLARKVKSGNNSDRFEFHTVGDPSVYANEVKEMANGGLLINHGIIANNQLPNFLKLIDVCVALTYASENGGGGGTSNAMLEQMAAARIILAWNNRIFKQYLDVDNAYLAEQYNVDVLEEALYKIMDRPELALEKATNARRSVQHYTYKANVNNFKKLLSQLNLNQK